MNEMINFNKNIIPVNKVLSPAILVKESECDKDSILKIVSDFINNPSLIKDELQLKIITKEKERRIVFTRITIHKVFNDNNIISHYDICGNDRYIYKLDKNGRIRQENLGIIAKINSEEVMINIENIVNHIASEINDKEFRKRWAYRYYGDDRKYLYKDGKFCPYSIPALQHPDYQKKLFVNIFNTTLKYLENLNNFEEIVKLNNDISLSLIEKYKGDERYSKYLKKFTSKVIYNLNQNEFDKFYLSQDDINKLIKGLKKYKTNKKKIALTNLVYTLLKGARLGYFYLIDDVEFRRVFRIFMCIVINSAKETGTLGFLRSMMLNGKWKRKIKK